MSHICSTTAHMNQVLGEAMGWGALPKLEKLLIYCGIGHWVILLWCPPRLAWRGESSPQGVGWLWSGKEAKRRPGLWCQATLAASKF